MSETVEMTRQEMFNRAWKGLKAQGWQQAIEGPTCVYLTPDGRRCAWGHVDPEGTAYGRGSPVSSLARNGIGLAAHLSPGDLSFAIQLQQTHDGAAPGDSRSLERAMRDLARLFDLSIPDEVTEPQLQLDTWETP